MLPIINIGPLALQAPGLILLLGIWLGLTLAERNAERFNINKNDLYNLVFVFLIAGVIGARLMYVLRYPEAFASNLFSLFSLNPSLLDPIGGAATGIVAALVFGQRKQMAFWSTLDGLTPLLAVFAIAWHLSNFASGNGFGAPTDLPWGIYLWGASRHPSQIYEMIAAGIILAYLWPSRQREPRLAGDYFLKFLGMSAGARIFLEAFRGDSILLPGGIRLAQAIAWLLLAFSLWGLWTRRSQPASHEGQTSTDLKTG